MHKPKSSNILLECEDGKTEKTDGILRLPIPAEKSGLEIPSVQSVSPKPGFCIKTKDDDGKKVFINIGTSDDIPAPPDVGEAELSNILQSEDPSSFKVPMSLGFPRFDTDKSAQQCLVMDVVINESFYKKTQGSMLFNTFLITIAIEGLEDKHKMKLNKHDWILLKNKKYFGTNSIPNVTIKKKLITEIKSNQNSTAAPFKKIAPKIPEFVLTKVSTDHNATSVFAEIKLPGVTKASSLQLRINDDRVVVDASVRGQKVFNLDIFLPVYINPEGAIARFHPVKQILYLSLKCEKEF